MTLALISPDVASIAMLILAPLGAIVTLAAGVSITRKIVSAFSAEREWKAAALRLSADRVRLIDAIIDEQRRVATGDITSSAARRRELIEALTETIVRLSNQHEISPEAAERMAQVLREASGPGRLSYAEKLASEAVKARRSRVRSDKEPYINA